MGLTVEISVDRFSEVFLVILHSNETNQSLPRLLEHISRAMDRFRHEIDILELVMSLLLQIPWFQGLLVQILQSQWRGTWL